MQYDFLVTWKKSHCIGLNREDYVGPTKELGHTKSKWQCWGKCLDITRVKGCEYHERNGNCVGILGIIIDPISLDLPEDSEVYWCARIEKEAGKYDCQLDNYLNPIFKPKFLTL
jgi:hypothetical protein